MMDDDINSLLDRSVKQDFGDDPSSLIKDVAGSLIDPKFRSNVAAHAASLTDNISDSYNQIMGEYNVFQSDSPTQDQIVSDAQKDYAGNQLDIYASALKDPSLDNNLKDIISGMYWDDRKNPPNLEKIVKANEASQPNNWESPDSVKYRESLYNDMDVSFRIAQMGQEALNRMKIETDEGLAGKAVDMVQYLIPLLDHRPARQLQEKLNQYKSSPAGTPFPTLLGEDIQNLKTRFQGMTQEDKLKFTTDMLNGFQGFSSSIVMGSNQLERMRLMEATIGGNYSTFSRVIDDAFDIMTFLGLAEVGKNILRGGKAFSKVNRALRAARAQSVYGPSAPMSLASTIEEANPEKFRILYNRALVDESGKVAQTFFGMSREDLAMTKQIPKPLDSAINEHLGSTNVGQANLYSTVKRTISDSGILNHTPEEVAQAVNNVQKDIENLTGFAYKPDVSEVGREALAGQSSVIKTKAVYGLLDGSPTVTADVSKARLVRALAKFGVEDSDVEIISQGAEGITKPNLRNLSKKQRVQAKADYQNAIEERNRQSLFRVTFNTNVSDDKDLVLRAIDPSYNQLDRFKIFGGSKWNKSQSTVTSHIFNNLSKFPKWVTQSANQAVDQAHRLANQVASHQKIAFDSFTALEKKEQGAVEEYIKQANHYGTMYDYGELRNKKWSEQAIDALKAFRSSQDLAWELSNLDLVRDARGKGYWLYESNTDTHTRLLLRNLDRGAFNGRGHRVYDPVKDKVVKLSAEEIDSLYEKGGYLASSKSQHIVDDTLEGASIGGKNGLPVLVDYSDGVTHRALKDNDILLNYREGYFHVKYNAPHFIERHFKNPENGEIEKSVIGVAGSHKEADRLLEELRLRNGDSKVSYEKRSDLSKEEISDYERDLSHSSGLSSQRVRGKPLSSSTSTDIENWENPYVEHPYISMSRNLSSVANRVMMRDWISTMKQRFNAQFGHLVKKGKFDQDLWPNSAEEIGLEGSYATKDVQDARTLYDYINQMENGFSSSIDDLWRSFINNTADILGGVSEIGEKSVRALDGSITKAARSVPTTAFITLSPFRQFFLNAHQSIQLIGLYPKEVIHMPKDMMFMLSRFVKDGLEKNGLKGKEAKELRSMESNPYYQELAESYMKSGLADSVKHHTLTSNALFNNADTALSRLETTGSGRFVKGAMELPKKVGMEAGEHVNKMTAYVCAFRRKKAEVGGRKLTKRELAEVASEAQARTLNFNKADELAYNANTLGLMFQFMQVPHKTLLQMTTDRTLSKLQKLRLAGFNLAMYGVPAAIGWEHYMNLIKDVDMPDSYREAVGFGVEAYILNRTITAMTGEETHIDFAGGGLSPLDESFIEENISNIFSGNMMEVMSKFPAVSLFYGTSPRIANAISAVSNLISPPDDERVKLTLLESAKKVAEISSGFSYFTRYKLAQRERMARSASGNVSDYHISGPEAFVSLLGLPTEDTTQYYALSDKMFNTNQDFANDVKQLYDKYKMFALAKDDPDEALRNLATLQPWIAEIRGQNPTGYIEEWNKNLKKDLRKGEYDPVSRSLNLYAKGKFGDVDFKQALEMFPPEVRDNFNNELKLLKEGSMKTDWN